MEPLPLLLRDGAFRVGEALDLGVAERRLRPGALPTPHHGVRSRREGTTFIDRCTDFLPAMARGQVFSHDTAAVLWGLPLPDGHRAANLHVTSPSAGRPRRPGVIGHRAAAVHGSFVFGLPVVDPLTTWCQCAALLDLDDVVTMGDALAGRWSKHSLARERPLDELRAAVAAWGNRRGTRRLQEALPLMRDRVWSPKETALRLAIARGGLPEPPERNAPVTNGGGEVLGHADLVYRRERLAIEYEGDAHRTDRDQWRRDVARYERFQDAGWRVLRVTVDDLGDTRILLHRISRHLDAAPSRHRDISTPRRRAATVGGARTGGTARDERGVATMTAASVKTPHPSFPEVAVH